MKSYVRREMRDNMSDLLLSHVHPKNAFAHSPQECCQLLARCLLSNAHPKVCCREYTPLLPCICPRCAVTYPPEVYLRPQCIVTCLPGVLCRMSAQGCLFICPPFCCHVSACGALLHVRPESSPTYPLRGTLSHVRPSTDIMCPLAAWCRMSDHSVLSCVGLKCAVTTRRFAATCPPFRCHMSLRVSAPGDVLSHVRPQCVVACPSGVRCHRCAGSPLPHVRPKVSRYMSAFLLSHTRLMRCHTSPVCV